MARPSTPLISRESAVRAALAVIDERGLDGWSLEEVARQLGVKGPSMYHHFKGRTDLLSEVVVLILRDIPAPDIDDGDFEATVERLCLAAFRAILKHPHAATLLLQFFPKHVFVRAYDFWASVCPYDESVQLEMLEGLEKLTFGAALFAGAERAAGKPGFPQINSSELPHLARALAATRFDEETLFAHTVRRYLAGFRNQPLRDNHTRPDAAAPIPLHHG